MAFKAHNVSMQHWGTKANELGVLEAVRELCDNMIFVGDERNATEGHIYFRDTDLGRSKATDAFEGTKSLLTFRDNGRGMSEKTWVERASRICRAADTSVGYTPDLAQTLSRYGVGINSAAPPLADDIYMFVCHGHGSARERFIVRMGMALNKALYAENNGKKDWVEQLGYAMLSIPAEFEYDSTSKHSAFRQLQNSIAEDDQGYTERSNYANEAMKLLLRASLFKSLGALLEVFKDFEAGTGVMYVRTQPQPNRDDLVPCKVDGIKDIRDQETGMTLRSYLSQTYLAHKAFRPLLEARLKEQQRQQLERNPKGPAPALLEPRCKLYVEGTAVRGRDHPFVQALHNSGHLNEDIDVEEISMTEDGNKKVLGWCTFTHQAKDLPTLQRLGETQRCGILDGYSCCLLSQDPSFPGLDVKSAQSYFHHQCEYWSLTADKKGAFKSMENMLSGDDNRPVEVPFTEADARLWSNFGIQPKVWRPRKKQNWKYCLGGAGILGIFILNEEHLPIRVAKNAALQKSLLPYAHALVLRGMMRWVFNNPPADYVEAKRQALEDVEKRAAKKAERGREAEARRLVSPLEPEQAPASGCKRKNPGRHSKDEARLRMSGAKRPAEQTRPLEDLRSPPCTAIAKMRNKCRRQKAFCQDLQEAITEVEAHTWPTPGAECALWAAKEFLKLVRTLNQRGMAPFPYIEELREKVQAALEVGRAGYVLSAQ